MIEIIAFENEYFDSMVKCYEKGFPEGYNRYALARLVRRQRDTIFIAIEQGVVVGVLIGTTGHNQAWFDSITVSSEVKPVQKCTLRLALAVANKFMELGFTKACFTTERRSILKLSKLIEAEEIIEESNFYFDESSRWVVTVNVKNIPKLIKLISK